MGGYFKKTQKNMNTKTQKNMNTQKIMTLVQQLYEMIGQINPDLNQAEQILTDIKALITN